ncbi:MAG TPA: ATP-binding protein [Albitalea sp.]|uniref:ATP-binding protein n=1 Tax=Piscinibacter sp. TaxID=1903157 RepID=UPI002ED012CC
MLLAAIVPLVAFAGAAWYLRDQAVAQARFRIESATRVAEEHALKVFETNVALLNRTADMLDDGSDQALLSREFEIHTALKRMTADLPQLQGLFIMDSGGRMVATNRLFPAPHDIDFTDRPLYRHHRAGGVQPFVTNTLTSRATGELFFDMSLRRNRADGTFGGVLSASMSPAYFAGFYRELTGGDKHLRIALVRSDDAVLARWPQPPEASDVAPGAGSTMKIEDSRGAVIAVELIDGARGLMEARPLGPYPIRVVAWMNMASILAPWHRQIALLAALMLPTAIGLAYVSWVALQRARNALRVLDELREETAHRRHVEDALRQAQKLEAMGRLTGGVAHDFNNLLMIVSNNLFLLQRLKPDVADSAQLTAIDRAVRAGSKLTRQLLSFSRRQALHPEVMHLQQHLPALLELLKPALGSAIHLSIDMDPATPPVEVDAAELELAMLNLAINAKDAMPDGGRLDITIANESPPDGQAAGSFACITVRDNGAGIAPELVNRVFEPFFTTKPVGQGTGLGLSQVYGFCARAGGRATLESRPGQGTAVRMFLPSAKSETDEQVQAPAPSITRLSGLRVLLVEDNDDVAAATQGVLESMGCIVSRRGNADEALQVLGGHMPDVDLMLSDIVMPGSMDGIELCSRARKLFPRLPVVLMSGYSESLSKAATQAMDVLPKPCAPAVLAAALEKAFDAMQGPSGKAA